MSENKENENKKLYSSHIFILPFKIKRDESSKKNRDELVLKEPKKWKKSNILEEEEDLNKYLNKYAKDALFSYQDSGEQEDGVSEKKYLGLEEAEFCIEYFNEKASKSLVLQLKEVRVKFFDTDIGTLSFFVDNYQYPSFRDILFINNQARKIYKTYEEDKKCSIITIKSLGKVVQQNIAKANMIFKEKEEILENNIISHFINLDKIEPILDDRMYTICHYLDSYQKINSLTKTWKEAIYFETEERLEYFSKRMLEDWYNYIFVDLDGECSCQDFYMMKDLLKKATYSRWLNYNSLYGISRYSFVLWSDDGEFSQKILNIHMKNHYFQMVSLVIAQKATILSLNEKINNILLQKKEETEEDKEYQEYLRYLSKMYFHEVTQQEQGIELYHLVQQQMDIKVLIHELDLKIKTLNEKEERRRDSIESENEKRIQKRIEMFGIIFTILGTLLGILGIDPSYLEDKDNILRFTISWIVNHIGILLVVLVVILFSRMLYYFLELIKKKVKKN